MVVKSFNVPLIDTVFMLPRNTEALTLANACRDAALQFMRGVNLEGWGGEEVVSWLAGPYTEVTTHSTSVLRARLGHAPEAYDRKIESLEGRELIRLARAAHEEVLEILRSAALPEGGTPFILSSLVSNLVTRCEDSEANKGWLPVGSPSVRLAERVLSLFAVDYLSRPEDYESQLSICVYCQNVTFDALNRARTACHLHASGIQQRRFDTEIDEVASNPTIADISA